MSWILYLNKIVSAATWQPHVFDAFAASGENQKWYSNRIAIYNILNLWRENREKHSFVHSETYYMIILKTTVNGSRHNCIWCLNDFGCESEIPSYINTSVYVGRNMMINIMNQISYLSDCFRITSNNSSNSWLLILAVQNYSPYKY